LSSGVGTEKTRRLIGFSRVRKDIFFLGEKLSFEEKNQQKKGSLDHRRGYFHDTKGRRRKKKGKGKVEMLAGGSGEKRGGVWTQAAGAGWKKPNYSFEGGGGEGPCRSSWRSAGEGKKKIRWHCRARAREKTALGPVGGRENRKRGGEKRDMCVKVTRKGGGENHPFLPSLLKGGMRYRDITGGVGEEGKKKRRTIPQSTQ